MMNAPRPATICSRSRTSASWPVQPVALADRILAGLHRASYETVHGNGHVAGDKAHED
jgi:hypothetical protein